MTLDGVRGGDTAGRMVIRALVGVFTAVVLFLLQSAFWSGRVSPWMQVIIVAMALLAYFRPQAAMLALAALVPLGQAGSRALDAQMRGAEALALAFLAGALVRGWTLREFRSFPSTRLEIAALVFGLVVAASCLEQIWFLQIQRDYPWRFIQDALAYAGHDYIGTFQRYSMIFRALLLVEGVALLLFALTYARQSPEFARRLVIMLVAGAVATTVLTFLDVADDVGSTNAGAASAVELIIQGRWSGHIRDVNAAGSFFAMAMFMAFGIAVCDRRLRAVATVSGLALAVATVLTHSRTAIAAAGFVALCLAAVLTLGRRIGAGMAVGITALGAVIVAVALWQFLPHEYLGPNASMAVEIRWLFLGTTWRMLLANPLFGVGVGQFTLWSVPFSAPELLKYYASGQNAHNNFAQIAGELGPAGLAAFVAVLGFALTWRELPRTCNGFVTPTILGVAAFILTWLGGHPLLVPEAAYPFWLALGVIAVGPFATANARHGARLAAGVLVLLLISIPIRVYAKAQRIDFSQVSYGLSARRIMTSRARFFVPADASGVEVPVRTRDATGDDPVVVDIFVDDIAAETISLTDREWQTARIDVPNDSPRRFHQMELRIRRSDRIARGDAVDPSVEVGTWNIISKPNG